VCIASRSRLLTFNATVFDNSYYVYQPFRLYINSTFLVGAGEPGALALADKIPQGVSGMRLSLGLIVQENKLPVGKILLTMVKSLYPTKVCGNEIAYDCT
jgi:hypothetical protein